MDYGTVLAKQVENPNRKSKHYAKQSKFEGSLRQLRANILKRLIKGPEKADELIKSFTDPRTKKALQGLEKEGFIKKEKNLYKLI